MFYCHHNFCALSEKLGILHFILLEKIVISILKRRSVMKFHIFLFDFLPIIILFRVWTSPRCLHSVKTVNPYSFLKIIIFFNISFFLVSQTYFILFVWFFYHLFTYIDFNFVVTVFSISPAPRLNIHYIWI